MLTSSLNLLLCSLETVYLYELSLSDISYHLTLKIKTIFLKDCKSSKYSLKSVNDSIYHNNYIKCTYLRKI